MDPAGSGTRGFGGPPRAPPADVDEVGTRGGGGVSPDEVSWDVRRLGSAPPYVHQLPAAASGGHIFRPQRATRGGSDSTSDIGRSTTGAGRQSSGGTKLS